MLATSVIRWEFGFRFFDFLGKEVSSFISFVFFRSRKDGSPSDARLLSRNSDAGSLFVFGANYEDHFFAFKVSSSIIFLSSVFNMLYYLGVMQYIICKIAWLMKNCLNTTAAEVSVRRSIGLKLEWRCVGIVDECRREYLRELE